MEKGKREILIAEDSPTQAQHLSYLLEKNGFFVRKAANGREALDLARGNRPDLIISDIVMPQLTGYELAAAVKQDEALRKTPVLLVSSLSNTRDLLLGMQSGADGFIVKPYEEDALIVRVQSILSPDETDAGDPGEDNPQVHFEGQTYLIKTSRRGMLNFLINTYETAVKNNILLRDTKEKLSELNESLERKVDDRTKSLNNEITERCHAEEELKKSFARIKKTLSGIVKALAITVEKRDPYTAGHEQRVAQLALAIAKEMGLGEDKIESLNIAAILHDIGKIAVPIEILSKPGTINDPEFTLIRFHPQTGHDILKQIDFEGPVAQIVLQHHERYNGSGYPAGLTAEDILLEARILSVADTFEAMFSHRPYRASRGMDKALLEIMKYRGTHYDPAVVDACIKVFTGRGFDFNDQG